MNKYKICYRYIFVVLSLWVEYSKYKTNKALILEIELHFIQHRPLPCWQLRRMSRDKHASKLEGSLCRPPFFLENCLYELHISFSCLIASLFTWISLSHHVTHNQYFLLVHHIIIGLEILGLYFSTTKKPKEKTLLPWILSSGRLAITFKTQTVAFYLFSRVKLCSVHLNIV